jgi:hypothetical protein
MIAQQVQLLHDVSWCPKEVNHSRERDAVSRRFSTGDGDLGIKVAAVEPGGFRTDRAGQSTVRAARSIGDDDAIIEPIRKRRMDASAQGRNFIPNVLPLRQTTSHGCRFGCSGTSANMNRSFTSIAASVTILAPPGATSTTTH